jgi:hypothetical protein
MVYTDLEMPLIGSGWPAEPSYPAVVPLSLAPMYTNQYAVSMVAYVVASAITFIGCEQSFSMTTPLMAKLLLSLTLLD